MLSESILVLAGLFCLLTIPVFLGTGSDLSTVSPRGLFGFIGSPFVGAYLLFRSIPFLFRLRYFEASEIGLECRLGFSKTLVKWERFSHLTIERQFRGTVVGVHEKDKYSGTVNTRPTYSLHLSKKRSQVLVMALERLIKSHGDFQTPIAKEIGSGTVSESELWPQQAQRIEK